MKKFSKKYFGFTLVELIIVITILAILATVAFVSFQNYTTQTRDIQKITSLSNISKKLDIILVQNGVLPIPDNVFNITFSGNVIVYQGNISNKLAGILGMGNNYLDSEGNNYIYGINNNKTKYQILTYLNNESNISSLNTKTFAGSYSGMYIKSLGNNLGLLLNSDKSPISSNQNIEILSTTGVYNQVFDTNNIVSGTGDKLKYGVSGGGLVTYFDFDSISGTTVFDKSINTLTGTLSGTYTITAGDRKIGNNSLYLSGGYFWVDRVLGLGETPSSPSSVSMGIKPNNIDICGNVGICRQWLLTLGTSGAGAQHWLFGGIVNYQIGIRNSIQFYDNLDIFPGNRTFLTMTFNGNDMKAYVNGKYYGKKSLNGNPITYNLKNASILLGAPSKTLSSTLSYSGYVDELSIYNRELSSEEINNLYLFSK